ncbi:MAG: erythromycin esterase family protein [Bacteriovorax sp.]|nr:erythromycin esterase family protein [Bacteriovorax sp.]
MKHTAFCDEIIKKANPLTGYSDHSDLRPLIDSIKNKKIVMLGESSHGTKEFYEWRSTISKELLLNHGFNFISVEGDWPPCQEVNKFIHGKNENKKDISKIGESPADQVLSHFSRWPTWMWANSEAAELITWLRALNSGNQNPYGFYGLDVYSLYESIDRVTKLLNQIDPQLAMKAKSFYSCFDSYRHDEKAYARSLFAIPEGCKKEVLSALNETLEYKLKNIKDQDEALFDAIQNARIVCNAENYYRAMVLAEEDSWNVRDTHMMDTLNMLLKHYGPDAKGIVWAHNTHIGDYRATDMLIHGQVNIGGLARQKYGKEKVALVGFSTYTGSVIASHSWDGPVQVLPIPKAIEKSVESEFHNAIPKVGSQDFYVLFDNEPEFSPLVETRGQRAIGVVYHPPSEHRGNYVPTILSDRYDAFVFFDETRPLTPLKVEVDYDKFPETYPYGTHV